MRPPGGMKGWKALLMSSSFPSRNLDQTHANARFQVALASTALLTRFGVAFLLVELLSGDGSIGQRVDSVNR